MMETEKIYLKAMKECEELRNNPEEQSKYKSFIPEIKIPDEITDKFRI